MDESAFRSCRIENCAVCTCGTHINTFLSCSVVVVVIAAVAAAVVVVAEVVAVVVIV